MFIGTEMEEEALMKRFLEKPCVSEVAEKRNVNGVECVSWKQV